LIHLHLLNNNTATVAELNELVAKLISKYTYIKISLSHYDNTYFGFQRFIYVRDILLKHHNIDYVLTIDDDQMFSVDWVEQMYNLREPKTYKAWYCKVWELTNIDYWNGSIVTYNDSKKNGKPDINEMHYGGAGGAIIDVSIFNSASKLWDIPTELPHGTNVYNIEDLWLSFVIRKEYGWKIKRTFLPEESTLNVPKSNSDAVALYKTLYTHKKILIEYLVKKYGL
jgi:hypothetical protein